jgi:hypothetical protein
MKRVSTVKVKFNNGQFATAIITIDSRIKTRLTRDEAQHQHDEAVDNVVSALRSLPYVGTAPLRSVQIR